MAVVDDLITELRRRGDTDPRLTDLLERLESHRPGNSIASLVVQAYSELSGALGAIQQSRDTLARYRLDQVDRSREKLSEVSAAAEVATTELMNGIDRSLGWLDRITADQGVRSEAVDAIRSELNALFHHLQFQDITAQQLAGVAALLDDISSRVTRALQLLDPSEAQDQVPNSTGNSSAYNADASFANVADRQATIDRAFVGPRGRS